MLFYDYASKICQIMEKYQQKMQKIYSGKYRDIWEEFQERDGKNIAFSTEFPEFSGNSLIEKLTWKTNNDCIWKPLVFLMKAKMLKKRPLSEFVNEVKIESPIISTT